MRLGALDWIGEHKSATISAAEICNILPHQYFCNVLRLQPQPRTTIHQLSLNESKSPELKRVVAAVHSSLRHIDVDRIETTCHYYYCNGIKFDASARDIVKLSLRKTYSNSYVLWNIISGRTTDCACSCDGECEKECESEKEKLTRNSFNWIYYYC